MPRGGRRSGAMGKAYPNRTDLSSNRDATAVSSSGPQYGDGAKLEAAQQAVPMGPPPGGLTGLTAPTDRPSEPLTAGLPMGAGPGPEALHTPSLTQGLQQLSEKSQHYLDFLAQRDDLPERVALALRVIRNSNGIR